MQPQVKAQAFYAFVDLEAGAYRLEIATEAFFPFTVSLQVPMALPLAEGILACTLEPGPLYPFEPWDTLIRGRVTRRRKPEAGVTVEARYAGQRSRTVSRQTRSWGSGAYDGRYALALGGRLAAATDITLNFTAPDGAQGRQVVRVTPSTMAIVDMDLD